MRSHTPPLLSLFHSYTLIKFEGRVAPPYFQLHGSCSLTALIRRLVKKKIWGSLGNVAAAVGILPPAAADLNSLLES